MQADPRDAWFHERQSAWLYRRLAAAESDPSRSRLFESLAGAAEAQAATWARHLGDDMARLAFRPGIRARLVAWLAGRLGPRAVRPALVALKMRGLSVYDGGVLGHAMPTRVDEIGARHRGIGSGGNLRAAVFGVNDGLVSNASLILGVAGAGAESPAILTAGVAGLLAGALSMAAGEYVSVRSQREMYQYQIGLERQELAEYPEEEAEELALIYAARGMDEDRARQLAQEIIATPELALDALAREELGLNPDDLGSPWGAAIASFLSFAIGAGMPLLPVLLATPGPSAPLAWVVAVTAVMLVTVGMTLSLFSGRGAIAGGLRMLAIGGGAGLLTWVIGALIGATLA